MSQKHWNWVMALGVAVCVVGLLLLPSALFSNSIDEGMLSAAGAMFGAGAMMVAGSTYFKATALRAEIAANPQLAAMLNGKRLKGGCDQCREAAPVILCTMHKQSLCATCMSQHYDSRACVYVPASRKTVPRNARSAAAARG